MAKSIKERKNEIADQIEEVTRTAKNENRDFTDAEKARLQELRREAVFVQQEELASMMRVNTTVVSKSAMGATVDLIRNAVREKKHTEIILRAGEEPSAPARTETSHITDDIANIEPLTVGEFVTKVEEKLIWDKIGIKMPTGLAGQYEWPVIGDLEAEFAGEGASLTEKRIDISKVAAVQQRVGVVASRTNQALINSAGVIDQIISEAMPKAIARAINNVVMNPVKPAGQTLAGPFTTATVLTKDFTFADLNDAKATLLAKGYEEEFLVWVMDAATKAALEATPKDSGSGIMVIENGKLCGCPVFVSSKMNGDIGLGDFRFQVVGQFGRVLLIVDPYSKAEQGKTRFVLETNIGTATLDKEAFVLVKKKTA